MPRKDIVESHTVRGYTVNIFKDSEAIEPDATSGRPMYLVVSHDELHYSTNNPHIGQLCTTHQKHEWYEAHCEDPAWFIVVVKVSNEGTKLMAAEADEALDHTSRHGGFVAVNKRDFVLWSYGFGTMNEDYIKFLIDSQDWEELVDNWLKDWSRYFSGNVLAFEVIDVNGRELARLCGYYATPPQVMDDAEDFVPDYETPPQDVAYLWMEASTNPDGTFTLGSAWDTMDHEFNSEEEAIADREKQYPHRDLWLCKRMTIPLSMYKGGR